MREKSERAKKERKRCPVTLTAHEVNSIGWRKLRAVAVWITQSAVGVVVVWSLSALTHSPALGEEGVVSTKLSDGFHKKSGIELNVIEGIVTDTV